MATSNCCFECLTDLKAAREHLKVDFKILRTYKISLRKRCCFFLPEYLKSELHILLTYCAVLILWYLQRETPIGWFERTKRDANYDCRHSGFHDLQRSGSDCPARLALSGTVSLPSCHSCGPQSVCMLCSARGVCFQRYFRRIMVVNGATF